MKLEIFKEGIHTIDGTPEYNGQNLVLAVHPYFCKNYYSDFNDYVIRLNEFISNFDGPLITLEEGGRLKQTVDHYVSLGNTTNRFFIKTKRADPKPIGMDYDMLIENLKQLGKGNPLELVGGYFWHRNSHWGNWSGCLGYVAGLLKKNDISINIKEDLIFS